MVKTLPSNAGGEGSIPGWGTEIPHALQCGQKLKKKKKRELPSTLLSDLWVFWLAIFSRLIIKLFWLEKWI